MSAAVNIANENAAPNLTPDLNPDAFTPKGAPLAWPEAPTIPEGPAKGKLDHQADSQDAPTQAE